MIPSTGTPALDEDELLELRDGLEDILAECVANLRRLEFCARWPHVIILTGATVPVREFGEFCATLKGGHDVEFLRLPQSEVEGGEIELRLFYGFEDADEAFCFKMWFG